MKIHVLYCRKSMEQWSFVKVWWVGLVAGLVVSLPVRAWAWDEATFFSQKRLIAHSFVLPRSPHDTRAQTVIGSPREYLVQPKDTLLDIPHYFDPGYNEIIGAQPSVDPRNPPAGESLMITAFSIIPR